MNIEIINTGSELLLGRILNTHQQWLCRELADAGYVVTRQVAVPDTGGDIQQAVREALGRADLIIVTGGLGPTSDDLTRDKIAQLLGRPLREDATTLRRITDFFAGRKRPMPASTVIQAMIPEGALILTNFNGTAPGLAIQVKPNSFRAGGKMAWLVLLPGPPRELHPMFREQVLPLVRQHMPLASPFARVTLRTSGLGESYVEEKIAPLLQPLVERGLEIGYCARVGDVEVRFTAQGEQSSRIVASARQIVEDAIGKHIYGVNDDTLESVVIARLTAGKKTLALAESCTGGFVSNRLTNVPGASAVFMAGYVTYSNAAKQDMLGVTAETLETHGAVSEPVARQMAEGARRRA
ncbi:MAG TPA: CinA family nicotinamide mononucleotide deamidase-related protein, partial [Verrucomicrobiae bacterium]|nr:CinA family nicotinamide mononucleotide deamidase-related protein [Verrucomicrobiae bacterium]